MEINKEVNEILIEAYEYAKKCGHRYITAEHLLYAISFQGKIVEMAKSLEGNIEELRKNIEEYLNEYIEKNNEEELIESYSFQQVVLHASEQVMFSGKDKISVEHLIASIYKLDDSYAAYYLDEYIGEEVEVLYYLSHNNESFNEDEFEINVNLDKSNKKEEKKQSILSTFATNLNKKITENNTDPLIGRDDIINRTVQILCRRTKNNPVHVGEPGVGKTSIVFGLTKLINDGNVPSKLKNAEIFSLDIGGMLAGTKYRGDFEERIKKVLDEIGTHENPIVYIDEIHNIVGAGSLSGGTLDASNLLKPYLTESKIKFIGATTYDEYKKHFEKDKALTRRFQIIEVKEPTIDESIEILNGLKSNYENYHNVKYTDEAIKFAVLLSHKYINDKYLPDKAIDVIDEAGAYISTNLDSEVVTIIDDKTIEAVISKICNIPQNTVEKDERESLKELELQLKKKVFGQNEAIDDVVRCIKISRAGLSDENKPIASMLFVGPTGVGKTEIAKTLANTLGVKLLRFDMSEYAEKHAAAKLIGAPPGYVGYEEGGLLTDAIRKNPYSVLLLDEVEKAHSDILNVLLQVMDYATLTDNQGRKADFRNVIIIMTSNAGAKDIGKKLVGFGERSIKGSAIMEEVKRFFMPEFRNRLDKIIVFNHVNEEMAINITKKQLKLFSEQLEKKKIYISFSDKCIDFVSKKGISAEYGAREIQRIINSEIKPILIDEILFGKLCDGGKTNIDILNNKFILQ